MERAKKKVDFHIFATVIWKDFKTPNTVVACQEITKIFIGRYFKVPCWLLSNKASNAKTSNNIFCRRHEDMKPMPKIGFLSDFCHGQPKKIWCQTDITSLLFFKNHLCWIIQAKGDTEKVQDRGWKFVNDCWLCKKTLSANEARAWSEEERKFIA